jgi:DNA polymerase-3 subunit gamma/tau
LSYLVLARKSRPQTFAEVVGQKAVVRTLQNGLRQGRVPHALIFSGVRGTGKTTLARIMAKALNCEKGPTDEPCCACRSCLEIKEGNSIDLHEIDGATNTSVDDIRKLKENISFMPTSSRFKIIIIDEVHMLSTSAFNALLKTLEEPPEHVYFIFATTELHKVPVTILSRCQRYELKRVAHRELFDHFARLAEEEGVSIEDQALNMIVREAGGSVRDGLSLLDQVFSYCGDTVTAEDVVEVLGLVSGEVIADLADALLNKDLARALAGLDQVHAYGMDRKRFINELLSWFRGLVICSVSREPARLLDLPADDLARLQQTASNHSRETLQLIFHMLMEGLEKASFSARPGFAIEMAFIKVVQAGDVVPVSQLLERLNTVLDGVRLEPVVPVQATRLSGPAAEHPSADRKNPASLSAEVKKPDIPVAEECSVQATSSPEPESVASGDPPVSQETEDPILEKKPAPDKPAAPAGKEKQINRADRDVRREWPDFINYVGDREKWMAATLQLAASAKITEGQLVIEYEDSVNCRIFKDRDKLIPLTEYAMDFFQQSLTVRFKVPDSSGCDTDPDSGAALQKERQALANDTLVLTACEIFNGQVGDIRVGPRFRKPLQADEDTE